MMKITNPLMISVLKFIGLILSIASVHWAIVQFYAHYCAPWVWYGPLSTILSLGSPVCQFANYVQFELAKNYITIWAAAGGAAIAYLFVKNPKNLNPKNLNPKNLNPKT